MLTEVDGSVDLAAAWRRPDAVAALRAVAQRLLDAGYANELGGPAPMLARLALAHPVERRELDGVLTAAEIGALLDSGLWAETDTGIEGNVVLVAAGPTLALVPIDPRIARDRVYLGPDSWWLADIVGKLAPGGARALDLGTGTGMLAALLAARYEHVVAADVLPRAAACAALTFACSRLAHASVCVADVATCFRPGTFDLVTANIPWVPGARDGDGNPVVFADAGSGGFELPRRFLLEGAAMLAPGGLMVAVALDLEWRDGRRPLDDVRSTLEGDGYSVAVVGTQAAREWPELEERLAAQVVDITRAEHVAIVVRQP